MELDPYRVDPRGARLADRHFLGERRGDGRGGTRICGAGRRGASVAAGTALTLNPSLQGEKPELLILLNQGSSTFVLVLSQLECDG